MPAMRISGLGSGVKLTNTRKVPREIAKRKRPAKLRQARQRFERAYVLDVLNQYDGDRIKTARVLGISYSSLKSKLKADFGASI